MALQAGPFHKAMLEEARQEGLVFRKRDDTVANVAGRKHIELFAQTSARTAVVADGHYGAQLVNLGMVGPIDRARSSDIALEPFK